MAAGSDANWEDIADVLDPPLMRLVAQTTQSIPDNTATAITFGSGSTSIDTHTMHSETTNTARCTPNVPGYYEFAGSYASAGMTTPASRSCYIRKNGTTALAPGPRDSGSTITSTKECTATIDMNGTTDYVELVGIQDSAGAVSTNASAQLSSVLTAKFIRPL